MRAGGSRSPAACQQQVPSEVPGSTNQALWIPSYFMTLKKPHLKAPAIELRQVLRELIIHLPTLVELPPIVWNVSAQEDLRPPL